LRKFKFCVTALVNRYHLGVQTRFLTVTRCICGITLFVLLQVWIVVLHVVVGATQDLQET